MKLIELEGIGVSYAQKLSKFGCDTTEDLLEQCGTKSGRQKMSELSEISEKLILEWVNLADLCRINGVGEEYSDLLEEAGVDSVVELATRNADNLHAKMVEVNEAKNLVNKLPSVSQLEDWVSQAKSLPRRVTH